METPIVLLILFLVFVLIALPIWTIVKILSLGSQNEALASQLSELTRELAFLRERIRPGPTPPASAPPPAVVAPLPPEREPPVALPEPAPALAAPPPIATFSPVVPIPEPVVEAPRDDAFAKEAEPPPLAEPPSFLTPPPRTPPSPAAAPVPRINWEQFLGAKLFAWLGGLALFLCVAFFVKYSFEHDLIPPEVRVALGFLFSLGLIVGGLKITLKKYSVLSQTLIAAGIVCLYAVSFACDSVYHFALFRDHPTLLALLMALITVTAFLLAVRLEARVIAILGILGGFLTPWLLKTGHDNPVGLFGYLALLDTGLIAVALHRRWHFLVPLGAGGTVLMQIGWAGKFFTDEKAGTAVIVCVAFSALFLAACGWARRREQSAPALTWSAVGLACVCFGFGLFFLGHPAVGGRAGLLFSFALLADLCLLALAWLESLPVLVGVAAGGTVLLQVNWAWLIFSADRAPTAMAVCLGFCALFLAAYVIARRLGRSAREITYSAVALPFVAFGFALFFLGYPTVAARPGLLFGFVLLADVCLLTLAWLDEELPKLHLAAGVAVFVLLAAWTGGRLTADLLPWALALYLSHAVLHTAFPLALERHRPAAAPSEWSQLFPPLALLLMLVPLFKLEAVSLLLWPCVLLVDLIAIALALVTASLVAVAVVLVLTLAATGLWIFKVPATLAAEPSLLLVLGGFAVLFFAAGVFLARRLGPKLRQVGAQTMPGLFGDARAQIPAFSALLPFVLLIMMTQRLPLGNPSPVFGLALLLTVLVLGLASILVIEWLPACALAGVAALEYAWRARHFTPADPALPLGWYLGFVAIFAAYPFVFRCRFAALTGPWAVAALGGLLQFPLVYQLVRAAWPNDFLGVLPALFALPPLFSLVAILRAAATDERARLNQLAWFGGAALFFITLVFPIQFDRQWLTLGWALEGAALCWLFHRVPHPGLRGTGAVLLVTAFARLALNPAVLEYHAGSNAPILNWYLYSYGVVTACLLVGARLLAPPRARVLGLDAPPLLNSLGAVLAFLLLNLEIADFFSTPGQRTLTFQFSGNFARDMSYTIGWALFALGLLLLSIWKQTRAGRYAALALLSVALLKLFFHDLARLDALYRVGALFAVAVIAIVASFAYQRFLPGSAKDAPPQS